MRIDVRPILYAPGQEIPFRFEMDLSSLTFGVCRPICRPVTVEGRIRNRAEALEMDLRATSRLQAVCDRCGKVFDRDKSADLHCALAETLHGQDSDDVLPIDPDGSVDVEALAREAFILEMDSKFLCREDCPGLCPRCGADLALGPCDCKKESDPRLSALSALLKPEEKRE